MSPTGGKKRTLRGKILAFRLGGLGDLLTAVPSLALLREDSPEAEFTVVCGETYGALLKEFGLAENVVSADSPLLTGLFHDPVEPDSSLRSWLGEFVETWVWMTRESGADLARSLAARGAAGVRVIGPPSRNLLRPYYAHFFVETASAIGSPLHESGIEGYRPLLEERVSDFDGGREESPYSVVIHPGSGGLGKCWPLERFLEVAGRLSARGAGGVLVTGEAEERLEPAIEKSSLPENWAWLRRPPLADLARLLGRCRFYLGNDSGVTHLAAARGAAVLTLYKNENAVLWKPFGNVAVLRAAEVAEISVEDVWREIIARRLAHV